MLDALVEILLYFSITISLIVAGFHYFHFGDPLRGIYWILVALFLLFLVGTHE